MKTPVQQRSRQRGVAAVEFALIALLFFTVLIGVMEMGRMLWTWNAAVEATRFGARMAVVCPIAQANTVRDRMIERLPALTRANVDIDYLDANGDPSACTSATCSAVRVSLTGYTHDTIIPLAPLSVLLPPFSTTLRKEFMDTAGNTVCS